MTYIDLFLQGERAERFMNHVSSYDPVMRNSEDTSLYNKLAKASGMACVVT